MLKYPSVFQALFLWRLRLNLLPYIVTQIYILIYKYLYIDIYSYNKIVLAYVCIYLEMIFGKTYYEGSLQINWRQNNYF